jgi:MFS superfamily sulfate permease-like transporter
MDSLAGVIPCSESHAQHSPSTLLLMLLLLLLLLLLQGAVYRLPTGAMSVVMSPSSIP